MVLPEHKCTHMQRVSTVSYNGFKEARRNVKSGRKMCEVTAKHCDSLVQETVGGLRDNEDPLCGSQS